MRFLVFLVALVAFLSTRLGSMNITDVLGVPSWIGQNADPISSGGPNQSFVAPAYSGPQTGVASTGPAPAISILGLGLLLVAWRILLELNSE